MPLAPPTPTPTPLGRAIAATGSYLRTALRGLGEKIGLRGAPLATADDVWNYLRTHPDEFALAAWDLRDEANGFFHNADAVWPLASTVKIIPLALCCHRLHRGEWTEQEPLENVERFYLPDTDGGAHEAAKRAMGGSIRTVGDALTAMIEFSDNAATDALLVKLGRSVVDTETSQLGDIAPPRPLAGTLLQELANVRGGTTHDRPWTIASMLNDDPGLAASLAEKLSSCPPRKLLRLARQFDNRGSARALAKVMERLYVDEAGLYEPARRRLGWPLRIAHNKDRFRQWGAKGGSLPSVLTSAQFAETTDGRRRALALFLHDLPLGRWTELSTSFAHQRVELEILNAVDPGSLLRDRLG